MLGAKIGKRVFDDGCTFTERRFVTIGDRCTLNAGSIVQCHSQEDGAFKSDRSTLGAGTTLGVGAFVHYGVQIGEGVVLQADSFLMKGYEVPAGARWGGNPAMELDAPQRQPPRPHHASHTGRAPADCLRAVRAVRGEACRTPQPMTASTGRACSPRRHHRRPALGHRPGARGRRARGAVRPSCRRPSTASLLLTAHAAVLAALSGEPDVVDRLRPAGRRRPLPCPLSAGPATWRELLDRTREPNASCSPTPDGPVEAVLRPGRPAAPTSPHDAVLRSASRQRDGELSLRLATAATRSTRRPPPASRATTCTALAPLATEPDAASARAQPALRGGARVPDRRAGGPAPRAARPPLPRAVRAAGARPPGRGRRRARDRRLDLPGAERPGQPLGHALLARGLRPRGRGRGGHRAQPRLDGRRCSRSSRPAACYLPVEPHLPADRIAGMLRRAECRARAHRAGQHDHARPGARRRCRRCSALPSIEDAYAEDHADADLGVAVAPDQLAYIYFTSGSTGEPKGAMCEHAGHAQPPPRQDRRPGDRRGRRGRPDRPAELRHLALAAGLGAAGRRPHADRRAGGDPRRGALRRHDRRRPGQRRPARAVLPRGRADLPGAAPPRAARPATASRSPARR